MSAEALERIAVALERIALSLEGGEQLVMKGKCEFCRRDGKLNLVVRKHRCPIHWSVT